MRIICTPSHAYNESEYQCDTTFKKEKQVQKQYSNNYNNFEQQFWILDNNFNVKSNPAIDINMAPKSNKYKFK